MHCPHSRDETMLRAHFHSKSTTIIGDETSINHSYFTGRLSLLMSLFVNINCCRSLKNTL